MGHDTIITPPHAHFFPTTTSCLLPRVRLSVFVFAFHACHSYLLLEEGHTHTSCPTHLHSQEGDLQPSHPPAFLPHYLPACLPPLALPRTISSFPSWKTLLLVPCLCYCPKSESSLQGRGKNRKSSNGDGYQWELFWACGILIFKSMHIMMRHVSAWHVGGCWWRMDGQATAGRKGEELVPRRRLLITHTTSQTSTGTHINLPK